MNLPVDNVDKNVNKSYLCVFLAILNIIYIHKF